MLPGPCRRAHGRPPRLVMQFIDESPLLDVVAYVATAIVAGHREALVGPLQDRRDLPGARGEAVRDALRLRAG